MKIIVPLFLIVAIIGVIYGIFWSLGAAPCAMRWTGSGFDTRYGILSGCQINAKGRWVPERVYREN